MSTRYVAFVGTRRFARGSLDEVVPAAKRRFDQGERERIAIFDEQTGHAVDLNYGLEVDQVLTHVKARLEPPEPDPPKPARGRGRPKLGVVSREVSLLPRHWEWLSAQRRGASATLRTLVEDARKQGQHDARIRDAVDRVHRFLWDMAGDQPGFEDATRALFARDFETFDRRIARWPVGIRELVQQMLASVREPAES